MPGSLTRDIYSISSGTVGPFTGTGNRVVAFAGHGSALATLDAAGNLQSGFGKGSLLLVGGAIYIVATVDNVNQVTLAHDKSGSMVAGQSYLLLSGVCPEAVIAGMLQNLVRGTVQRPFNELVFDDGNKRFLWIVEGGLLKLKVGPTRPAGAAETAVNTALTIDPATGLILQMRERLSANRSYFVRPDGNDNNTGLTNTAGGAFLTLQGAYNKIVASLDFNGFDVTVFVADGTYTTGLTPNLPPVGGRRIFYQGNIGSPQNCIVSVTSAHPFLNAQPNFELQIAGFEVRTTTAGNGVYAFGGRIVIYGKMRFGTCINDHILAQDGGVVTVAAACDISGNAGGSHWRVASFGQIQSILQPITTIGTRNFTDFAKAEQGWINAALSTFPGPAATGRRFTSQRQGRLSTNGGGVNFFPGNVAGVTDAATFGLYD